jgi:hypothetical protein
MRFFAQDLYNSPPATPTQNVTITSRPSIFNLNFLNGLDLGQILIGFNNFALVWSVFVSMMFVADFYFYYVKQSDAEIPREKMGQKALWTAARIWWRYLPGLVLTVLYVFINSSFWANLVAILAILAFVVKIWQDLYDFLGITTYFDWYNGFARGFRNFLSLKAFKIIKKGKK